MKMNEDKCITFDENRRKIMRILWKYDENMLKMDGNRYKFTKIIGGNWWKIIENYGNLLNPMKNYVNW